VSERERENIKNAAAATLRSLQNTSSAKITTRAFFFAPRVLTAALSGSHQIIKLTFLCVYVWVRASERVSKRACGTGAPLIGSHGARARRKSKVNFLSIFQLQVSLRRVYVCWVISTNDSDERMTFICIYICSVSYIQDYAYNSFCVWIKEGLFLSFLYQIWIYFTMMDFVSNNYTFFKFLSMIILHSFRLVQILSDFI
jgi:hypothetical protein